MIRYTVGNLLDAEAEALVNTVNTVGVMGKGIALMFKERFAKNMADYAQACKEKRVLTGQVLVTETGELMGPRWIVNFPTKKHWRSPSKMEWIVDGLQDLRRFIEDSGVRSIAIPPLGAGNGGLEWCDVKSEIEQALADLENVDILVFEPTQQYQNVAKKTGVKKLTAARALVADLVRRYWVLGMECSLLEIQKLAWFLERVIESNDDANPLKLQFETNRYGPYADNLRHLLDALDGSYLRSNRRIADSDPLDVIWFDDKQKDRVQTYLRTEAKQYQPALEKAAAIIDGFESPFGMELLSTVDWLVTREGCEPTVEAVEAGIRQWPGGQGAGQRKAALFDRRTIQIALNRLQQAGI